MVRFSDIIRSKDNKDKEKGPPESVKQREGFRLSDSWFFKYRNLDESPPVARKASAFELSSYYNSFMDKARETGGWIRKDMQISPSPVLSDLHAIIDRGLIDSLYEYAMAGKNSRGDLLVHTVDVTFTALKIGKGMNYDIKMMLRLGLAAFLENAGMYKVPLNILTKKEKLSEEETSLIRKHPETSYDLLLNLGERYKWLAETALSIHERSDGSGYPSGKKEGEIPELAAIIGLADAYCAMIKNRPYRNKFLQPDAIKSITSADIGKFPSNIIKAFLREISLFPVNSYVRLNNGSIGRVISINSMHPLSPVVEITYDSEGKKLNKSLEIILSNDPLLYIDRCIDPDDLAH